jgi:methyl-accepting chemotaxis protein
MQYMDSYKTANNKTIDYFTICMNRRIETAKANNSVNNQLANNMTIALIIILVLGACGSVGVGILLSRSLSQPINEMAVAAKNLAQGNLDVDITYVSKDEIGSLANSLKSAAHTLKLYVSDISANLDLMAQCDMTAEISQEYLGEFVPIKDSFLRITNQLNDTLTTISKTTEQVNSGADQASGGAQALALGATEQASSIQELSATITEISESLRQNAQNVGLVTGYVENAVTGMRQGDQEMQQMLAAMDKINSSSNEIKKIIKVIEDIAFQTNILALNAAVEAARAGSAGKGFAVVADEVRNLASKSASAAKQTTELIEGSIQDVKEGSKIADSTAKLLSEVEEKVQLVGGAIEQIDKASSEQAVSISQITQGVEQISAVVQTNSATAEQSAASSEELSAQAELLRSLIAQFKLKDGASFPQSEYESQAYENIEPLSDEQPDDNEPEQEDLTTNADTSETV